MSDPIRDPASYRDPAGSIYHAGDRILRTINETAFEDFEQVLASGLLGSLADQGLAVASRNVDPGEFEGLSHGAYRVLEHQALPVISYPYEWCFSALKAAALLHLEIHLAALERNVTLCDASAYNVQFLGADPIFIDILSFRPYREGEFWQGYRQFCEQFLNPLLLRALLGIPHNAWFRGHIEGVPTDALRPLLPIRSHFSWNVLTHVVLHAALANTISA